MLTILLLLLCSCCNTWMTHVNMTFNWPISYLPFWVVVPHWTVKTLSTITGTSGALQSGVVISLIFCVFFSTIQPSTLVAFSLHTACVLGYMLKLKRIDSVGHGHMMQVITKNNEKPVRGSSVYR